MKPLVCFTAILKNEAGNIRETLESVRSLADCWLVLDTGSTDGTQAIVREVMAGIPGELREEPFIDFAASRNRCLELAGESAEFTLTLSGDEKLYEGAALRAYLEEKRAAADGAYMVEIRNGGGNGQKWLYPRVLRTGAEWRYVGDVHEVPEGPGHARGGPTVPLTHIIHTATDPARKFKRLREYDLPRLEARIAKNRDADPEELAQAIWFLAQTHEALAAEHPPDVPGGPGQAHMLQAMALYRKRAEIGSDQLHAGYSLLCSLRVATQLSRHLGLGGIYTHEEFVRRLDIVKAMSPRLPEAHYLAAYHAGRLDARRGLFLAQEAAKVAREAAKAIADRDQTFYLPTDARMEWMSLRIAADCAAALDNMKYARQLATEALAAGGPPEVFADFFAMAQPEEKTA